MCNSTPNEFIEFVNSHPPRCVVGLNPKPVQATLPTMLLPPSLSVFNGVSAEINSDSCPSPSFVIGCPCGHRSVYILGYDVPIDETDTVVFVGPLRLECTQCGAVSELFDTRVHGFDGEHGINTHYIGEGAPTRFKCPRCGEVPFIVCAIFSYSGFDELYGKAREKPEDFFDDFTLTGQCGRCNSVVEVTSFECA
jgi:hypothetical protein